MGFAWTKNKKRERERERIPHTTSVSPLQPNTQFALQKALTPSKHSNDVKLYTA